MFAALSLLEAGYTVFANSDASGTFDPRQADIANNRMIQAGVYVLPQFAVAADLQRDWRNPPGIADFLKVLWAYVYFRQDSIPIVTDASRIISVASPASTTSSGNTAVPSSTAPSSPARTISSFKALLGFALPNNLFQAHFTTLSRLILYFAPRFEISNNFVFLLLGRIPSDYAPQTGIESLQ